MSKRGPRSDEQLAVDGIGAVEEMAKAPAYEPDGPSGPDWRVWLAAGGIADVEVTTRPDGEMSGFFAALLKRDGSPKVWSDDRLTHRWTTVVIDHSPGVNKARRSLRTLREQLVATLAAVEAAGTAPEQMRRRAQEAIYGATLVALAQPADLSITLWDCPVLHILDGERSQRLRVSVPPTWVGPKGGSIEMVPLGGPRGVSLGHGDGDMVEVMRGCIDAKREKRQLDDALSMKWLAVVLDGDAGIQLKHRYGGGSQKPPPKLDGVSFDYFDEVWAIIPTCDDRWQSSGSRVGPSFEPIFVVLRLSDGGETQRHYVVPRAAPREATA